MSSNVELWCILYCLPGQAVEQTVEVILVRHGVTVIDGVQ